jgi:hypothetical protein
MPLEIVAKATMTERKNSVELGVDEASRDHTTRGAERESEDDRILELGASVVTTVESVLVMPVAERAALLTIAEPDTVMEPFVRRDPPAAEWTGTELDCRPITVANRSLALDDPHILPGRSETLERSLTYMPGESSVG